MLRTLVLLATLFAASAFNIPSRSIRSPRKPLNMKYEDEIGALEPTGYWDPLGLANDIDQDTFRQRRSAELKHGRIAMLAVVGYLAAAVARLPGDIDLDGTTFQSIPNGVAALKAIPPFGWFQIAASIGYWEVFGFKQVDGSVPGDFGWGFFGRKLEGSDKRDKLTKELQNGRLAMLGIAELLTHDVARPTDSLFSLLFF